MQAMEKLSPEALRRLEGWAGSLTADQVRLLREILARKQEGSR